MKRFSLFGDQATPVTQPLCDVNVDLTTAPSIERKRKHYNLEQWYTYQIEIQSSYVEK